MVRKPNVRLNDFTRFVGAKFSRLGQAITKEFWNFSITSLLSCSFVRFYHSKKRHKDCMGAIINFGRANSANNASDSWLGYAKKHCGTSLVKNCPLPAPRVE